MRRLIQAAGVEVIHLGHNRSVAEVVRAAIQEDADAIARQLLPGRARRVLPLHGRHAARGAAPATSASSAAAAARSRAAEIAELEAYGVERIYSPERRPRARPRRDDRRSRRARVRQRSRRPSCPEPGSSPATTSPSREMLSALEDGVIAARTTSTQREAEWSARGAGVPVVGITGTGGAGKSTVTDEILARFLDSLPRASRSPSSRSIRRAAAPAARCSATGSG